MPTESQHTSIDATPVKTYLRGCVGYPVPDEAILSIFVRRNIDSDTAVFDVTKKQLDLCTADLYVWCATSPSVWSSVEDSDAGWKHKEGGSQRSASDASRLIALANSIYAMYGETPKAVSSIKMNPIGMRVWRRR